MKTGLWCGWWWFISLTPRSLRFHIVVQYPLFITHHNILKMKRFHYVSVENRMQKYGQEGFFCLTYMEPKHQCDEHNQAGANDFQCLIWIFRLCRLSPAWHNVDCSQLMSRFDRYQLQLVYATVEHRPARNLQHKTSQTTFNTFDQSQHLLHTLHKSFFAFQLHFYLSWNNKAQYAENIASFLPSSILKWLHKSSPILIFFLMQADMITVTIQSNKIVLNEVKDN